MMLAAGWLALAIWAALIASGFWTTREHDEAAGFVAPAIWPEVVAIVPARDEADVIARALGSLAAQDYPGKFRIVLVDDNSTDGTADIGRRLSFFRHPDGSQDPLCASVDGQAGAFGCATIGASSPSLAAPAGEDCKHVDPSREWMLTSVSMTNELASVCPKSEDLACFTIISGAPLSAGWTGKLWALHQGIAAAGTPAWLWLTDADIAHAPDTLRQLVGIANGSQRKLVSFMALLHCRTWAERMLVPAFIYFFKLVYPFAWINRPGAFAGAAGGCVLVERQALAAMGGVAAIRGALIDDCTLGRLIKRQGPIWLGLTRRSRSLRPYVNASEIAAMIARSAYAQLRYDPLLLVGTMAGLALVFGMPPALVLAATGWARGLGLMATTLMVLSWQPVLAWYRRSPLWGLVLPLVATFYAGCTLDAACAHYRGRGGMWKGRVQAAG